MFGVELGFQLGRHFEVDAQVEAELELQMKTDVDVDVEVGVGNVFEFRVETRS